MPTRLASRRLTACALGLSSVLLATSFSVLPANAQEPSPTPTEAAESVETTDPELQGAGGGAAGAEDGAETDASLVCPAGFDDIHTKRDMSLHGVTLTNAGALAVGFARRRHSDSRRRPAAISWTADTWDRVDLGSPGREDGLVAVSAGRGAQAWAVGFTTIRQHVMPLAMRWTGKRWRVNRPRSRGSLPAMFTDVAIVGGGDPFAVGYRLTGNGRRLPIAARKDGKRWTYFDPRVGSRESVSFTGVGHDRRGGIWVVGNGGPGAEIHPVIYRRDKARWTRQRVPRPAGEAALADVVATSRAEAWAVGYQRVDNRSLPLVMRWDGKAWDRVAAPEFDSNDVVLTAVSAAPDGGVWVVGAAWNAEITSHQAVAAWWDGQAWDTVASPRGGTELHDVVGSLDTNGWAVGRSGKQARTTRVCTPLQSGIFGGSEPTDPGSPGLPDELLADPVTAAHGEAGSPATASTEDEDEAATAAGAVEGAAADDASDAPPAVAVADGDDGPVTEQEAGADVLTRKKSKASRRERAREQRQRRKADRSLPRAKVDGRIQARNVARQAGIAESINTYSAVVADFDGDGLQDLFIGRHGRSGRLVLNKGGRFEDLESTPFPSIDRHGCAAADIDGSGLPDLFCAVGGKRGSGFKSNELWIDPGAPEPSDMAVPVGIADSLGRGRNSIFLQTDDVADTSLVVTNSPTRVDGLPSPGRLYRVTGALDFRTRVRPGFAAGLGSLNLASGDFDADGREDLVLVTGGPQAPQQKGTRLYRNSKRGLVDVTRRVGIRSFGEVDAELVDLDRDRHLDLVQLSPTRLRVSIQSKGRFIPVYERRLSHGRAIAAGDIDGDGRDDLYILRSNGVRNSADVMLVNRGGGRKWTSMVIPQVYSGNGDDAVAIDHDDNGLEDFVVLNGRTVRGPIALIAFYER